MKSRVCAYICLACFWLLWSSPSRSLASASKKAESSFERIFLGKDVMALLDMPAYKDGIDVYVDHKQDKHLDDRGLDLKELSKYLKEKGVGVERNEWVTITDVKVESDRIEIHLGGGGEGSGASKRADKQGAGYKRAGGSRINFRYGRDLTDADLDIDAFLPLLSRVLDTSKIRVAEIPRDVPQQFQEAIRAKDIVTGMSYQMVLLSAGEPDQKKVEDSSDDSLHETWYYMKDGHRWVVRFVNGKVAKVQVF